MRMHQKELRMPKASQLVARSVIACVAMCLLITVTSCSKPAPSAPGTVSGVINYPPDPDAATALLEVQLKDLSASGSENLIAVQRITKPGPAPVRYSIPYLQQSIDATHHYAVEARLIVPDRVLYLSEPQAVITFGKSTQQDLKMMPGGSPAEGPDTSNERTVNAKLATDSGEVEYVAHLSGQHVARIEEQRHSPSGDVRANYTFTDARLVSAEETSAAGQPIVTVTFNDKGQAESVAQWRDGKSIQPDPKEASRLRNHAELLRNHALASAAAQQHRANY
jgi:uncharacterized lipoprotein YbaY